MRSVFFLGIYFLCAKLLDGCESSGRKNDIAEPKKLLVYSSDVQNSLLAQPTRLDESTRDNSTESISRTVTNIDIPNMKPDEEISGQKAVQIELSGQSQILLEPLEKLIKTEINGETEILLEPNTETITKKKQDEILLEKDESMPQKSEFFGEVVDNGQLKDKACKLSAIDEEERELATKKIEDEFSETGCNEEDASCYESDIEEIESQEVIDDKDFEEGNDDEDCEEGTDDEAFDEEASIEEETNPELTAESLLVQLKSFWIEAELDWGNGNKQDHEFYQNMFDQITRAGIAFVSSISVTDSEQEVCRAIETHLKGSKEENEGAFDLVNENHHNKLSETEFRIYCAKIIEEVRKDENKWAEHIDDARKLAPEKASNSIFSKIVCGNYRRRRSWATRERNSIPLEARFGAQDMACRCTSSLINLAILGHLYYTMSSQLVRETLSRVDEVSFQCPVQVRSNDMPQGNEQEKAEIRDIDIAIQVLRGFVAMSFADLCHLAEKNSSPHGLLSSPQFQQFLKRSRAVGILKTSKSILGNPEMKCVHSTAAISDNWPPVNVIEIWSNHITSAMELKTRLQRKEKKKKRDREYRTMNDLLEYHKDYFANRTPFSTNNNLLTVVSKCYSRFFSDQDGHSESRFSRKQVEFLELLQAESSEKDSDNNS